MAVRADRAITNQAFGDLTRLEGKVAIGAGGFLTFCPDTEYNRMEPAIRATYQWGSQFAAYNERYEQINALRRNHYRILEGAQRRRITDEDIRLVETDFKRHLSLRTNDLDRSMESLNRELESFDKKLEKVKDDISKIRGLLDDLQFNQDQRDDYLFLLGKEQTDFLARKDYIETELNNSLVKIANNIGKTLASRGLRDSISKSYTKRFQEKYDALMQLHDDYLETRRDYCWYIKDYSTIAADKVKSVYGNRFSRLISGTAGFFAPNLLIGALKGATWIFGNLPYSKVLENYTGVPLIANIISAGLGFYIDGVRRTGAWNPFSKKFWGYGRPDVDLFALDRTPDGGAARAMDARDEVLLQTRERTMDLNDQLEALQAAEESIGNRADYEELAERLGGKKGILKTYGETFFRSALPIPDAEGDDIQSELIQDINLAFREPIFYQGFNNGRIFTKQALFGDAQRRRDYPRLRRLLNIDLPFYYERVSARDAQIVALQRLIDDATSPRSERSRPHKLFETMSKGEKRQGFSNLSKCVKKSLEHYYFDIRNPKDKAFLNALMEYGNRNDITGSETFAAMIAGPDGWYNISGFKTTPSLAVREAYKNAYAAYLRDIR